MTEVRDIPIYFDLLFKKIFADSSDMEPLKYLLELILNIKIKNIEIISPEVIGKRYKDKRTYLDLLVKLEGGTKISIEVNTNPKSYVIDRNLFFLFRVMGSDLDKGESYTELNKHYQINLNTNIRQKNLIMKYFLANLETKEKLTEKLEIINIDIAKYGQTWYTLDNPSELDKLMGLIGTKENEKLKYFEGEKGMIKKIMKKADKFRNDKDVVRVYDYDVMRDEREKLAFKEGIKEGINETTLEIAKNMLKKDIDVNFICEVTGLTINKINELK